MDLSPALKGRLRIWARPLTSLWWQWPFNKSSNGRSQTSWQSGWAHICLLSWAGLFLKPTDREASVFPQRAVSDLCTGGGGGGGGQVPLIWLATLVLVWGVKKPLVAVWQTKASPSRHWQRLAMPRWCSCTSPYYPLHTTTLPLLLLLPMHSPKHHTATFTLPHTTVLRTTTL